MKGCVRFAGAAIVAYSAFAEAVATPVFDYDYRSTETSLANLPSLKLHVTFDSKAQELYGESEFDIFANPLVSEDGEKVLYEGFATLVEDESRTTYSFVDGAPYLVKNDSSSNTASVRCIPQSTFPFDALLSAFNDATPVSSVTVGGEAVECVDGNLFKTSLAGIDYAICLTGKSGFTAFASDITIDVDYLDRRVSIPKANLSDGSLCKATSKATEMTPTALALLSGSTLPLSTSRRLAEEAQLAAASATCSCNSFRRPCLFFHGLGNENEEPDVQNTSRHFGWKIIKDHAPCCTTIKYAALNTVDYAWTDPSLQQKVCDRSLSMSASSDLSTRTIHDTIIVTHSMGGLMFAGALANKRCRLAESSKWISISAPMTGSMSSDYLMDYCNGKVQNFVTGLLFSDKCPVPKSTMSVAYKVEKYSYPALNTAYARAGEAYRKNVYAAMCSSSNVGNISRYQAKYMMGGTIIPHKSSRNDGLVEFHSCAGGIPESKFTKSPFDRFYKCELNHADTAFKTGDGIFKTTVRPVTWFECLL